MPAPAVKVVTTTVAFFGCVAKKRSASWSRQHFASCRVELRTMQFAFENLSDSGDGESLIGAVHSKGIQAVLVPRHDDAS